MADSIETAIRDLLEQRQLESVWWGAAILEAWPRVVGEHYASRAAPILEASAVRERGLLVIGVPTSAWMQELSFIDIAAELNRELGVNLIRQVRFELRGDKP